MKTSLMLILKLSTTSKVLILGAGYLGRRLVSKFHKLGFLVDTVTRETQLDSSEIHQHFTCHGDPEQYKKILLKSQAESIVICWAPGSRSGDSSQYLDTYWNSLLALEDGFASGLFPKHIIYTSSTSVYADQNGALKSEQDLPNATDERAKILIQAENKVLAWAKSFPLTSQVLRCSGIIGPERWPGLRSLKTGLPIAGNGRAWLNLIHIEDLCMAILKCIETSQSKLWNLSAISLPRNELYCAIAQRYNLPMPTWEFESENNIGRQIDSSLIKAELNWKPEYQTLKDLLRV